MEANPPISTHNDNRIAGRFFEEAFLKEAKSCGLFAKKNDLSCKYGWKGRLVLSKAQLDFTLIQPGGRVGFFDCKSFARDIFKYSEITPHQLDQALLFEELGVPSGIVAYFRGLNKVVFYTASAIEKSGPGTSLRAEAGLCLGSLESFDLRPIMRKGSASHTGVFKCGVKKKADNRNEHRV